MHIFEVPMVALEGGPCGGKTTGLVRVEQTLTERGWLVMIIHEIATEFRNSGIWFGEELLHPVTFQKYLMQYLKSKEELWQQIASHMNHKDKNKIVIICDRGLMDSKAYLNDDEAFYEILGEVGLNEIEARDSRYKAVIHMVTAADGAEEFYTLENNKVRTESAEDARIIDKRIQHAWTGHPHLRVIGNSMTFEEKIKRVIAEICTALGEPVPLETERKFLIERPSDELLKDLFAVELYIKQTYLKGNTGDQERVRKRGNGHHFLYIHTIKQFISDGQNIEPEKFIDGNMYRQLLLNADTKRRPIEKMRSCFIDPFADQRFYWEIDRFITPDIIIKPYQALMELECHKLDELVQYPPGIKVIAEVTGDQKYGNHSMAELQ